MLRWLKDISLVAFFGKRELHLLPMPWYELNSANDPKLNELAQKYQLHPLHLEDAHSPDERIKVDQTGHWDISIGRE